MFYLLKGTIDPQRGSLQSPCIAGVKTRDLLPRCPLKNMSYGLNSFGGLYRGEENCRAYYGIQ